MEENNISITLWGDGVEKGAWVEWYNDIKELMINLGYLHTHIGIISQSYTKGKILTVARKEKEILTKINDGEKPLSLSCYSLPKGYRVASFDYNFLGERNGSYISVVIKGVDYNSYNEHLIISKIKKYIDFKFGEIYSTSRSEMPLLYAETRDVNNVNTYKLIKKIDN